MSIPKPRSSLLYIVQLIDTVTTELNNAITERRQRTDEVLFRLFRSAKHQLIGIYS